MAFKKLKTLRNIVLITSLGLSTVYLSDYFSKKNDSLNQENCSKECLNNDSEEINQLETMIEEPVKKEYQNSILKNYYNPQWSLAELTNLYIQNNLTKKINKRIVINKSKRNLQVYINDIFLKEYHISLGYNPEGDKVRRGDYKTPEGEFFIAQKIPDSEFYKSLLISYPNKEDAERGLRHKLIDSEQSEVIKTQINMCKTPLQNTKLGGSIEIHGGNGSGPRSSDWTWGCIALTDKAMEELYNFAEIGCKTKVIIKP